MILKNTFKQNNAPTKKLKTFKENVVGKYITYFTSVGMLFT